MGVNNYYYSLLRDFSLFVLPLQTGALFFLTQTSLRNLVFAHCQVILCCLTPNLTKVMERNHTKAYES